VDDPGSPRRAARKVLVTGFGPFPGVDRNPTAELARALDGTRVGDARIVGIVLPVAYKRGPDLAIATARSIDAALVLGFGVAMRRTHVCVEHIGRHVVRGDPDVDKDTDPGLAPGDVRATLDCAVLARALDAERSDDAGAYVCNAWLHRVTRELAGIPVGFVHVPAESISLDRVRAGLAALLGQPAA
jgi:pyroglutamyl-peptidase